MDKIINIAVVAHVDAGKSTLVNALLEQNGAFRSNEVVQDCVMDSNELERERGITIYSKNCSIKYKDYKINIVDTPGHADFSSEVERIMRTVDTVVLIVDAKEGPMPQTRFVLKKALEQHLKPILFINKIDKKDARPEEVVNMTFELFMELNATDEQLDFPIVYGVARDGKASLDLNNLGESIEPLLDVVINHVEPYKGDVNDNLQMQVSQLDYDSFIGRLGIGRVTKGMIKNGETVTLCRNGSDKVETFRISKLFISEGIRRREVNEAYYGDIVIFAGCSDISIGDTVCTKGIVDSLPEIVIEPPTMAMNFMVNTSPFAGQSGKFLTSRHIRERLDKELETNVGLTVEELPGTDGFKVSGRGELHLSVLLEQMRREGFELCVSKPEVLYEEIDGKKCEPFEKVIVNSPSEYASTIISDLQERKATLLIMTNSTTDAGYTHLEFSAPTRGLIGYRSAFITNTKGEGIMVRSFDDYKPYVGQIQGRKNGVLVSMESGKTLGYSLFSLQDRGQLITGPATDVYVGMLVGINNRDSDLNVNPCKNKEMSNTRSKAADDAIALVPYKTFTLEEALEFIADDEYVEITPDAIRMRKKILDPNERYRITRK